MTAKVDLMEPATMECPFGAYATLRDEAPVFHDPQTGMYVITRYDDVKAVLRDTKRYVVSNRAMQPRQHLVLETYENEGGIVPAPAMSNLDNPEHRVLRGLYNEAFSPRSVAQFEDFLRQLANEIVDSFIGHGECEFIADFAVPLPLRVIGHVMGIESQDDLNRIKVWTDAWVSRRGLAQSDEDVVRTTRLEVEAQRYFQPIIDRLRQEPERDGLLGHVVRAIVPEWGDRTMNDAEAQTACLQEMFVAGAETTTSAFGHMLKMLIDTPDLWARLGANPSLVPAFVEESLRVESPVQGHFRRVTEDVELHGVHIPEGALVNIRYGAANLDPRHYEDPEHVDLEGDDLSRHLAFGHGAHACLGAPLARLELRVGLEVLLDRLATVWFPVGANTFRHKPNFVVRGFEQLHIAFTAC